VAARDFPLHAGSLNRPEQQYPSADPAWVAMRVAPCDREVTGWPRAFAQIPGGRRERGPGEWVMAKVYVSSTIIDLQPERQAVLDWLWLARHQAVDSYLPESDTVRASCLNDVAGCDLYLLVLGQVRVPARSRESGN
jgi:hypothetical protein